MYFKEDVRSRNKIMNDYKTALKSYRLFENHCAINIRAKYRMELHKAEKRKNSYFKRKNSIIKNIKKLEKYQGNKETDTVYHKLRDGTERSIKSFQLDFEYSGDVRDFNEYAWSTLIKRNVTDVYMDTGEVDRKALHRVQHPEEYLWNRARDKEGVGVSVGFNASMRDVHYMIKPLKTKSETGASSYPSSPYKIR